MTEEPADVVGGDRFTGGPARGFLTSMPVDERIFYADLAVDRAHVIMLAEQGIISRDDASVILDALETIEADGFDSLPDAEDVHAAIETAVIAHVGEVGGRIHTARSRNDEVATCIRFRLRNDLITALGTVISLRQTLLETAAEHTDALMPGYTHQQHAQPTTVAHWLLSYESAFARDTTRLLNAYAHVNQSPLGAAAFAGTPFSIDRDRTASLLGFDEVIENSMDAVSTRDFLIETTGALTSVSIALSGLATDVIGFTRDGFIELSDDYSSTSSIMPQKKNPDTMELIRASTGDATGGLLALITILKGLPRAYNRDLQRATRHLWPTIDAVIQATTIAMGAIATAEWNESTLAEAAGSGFSTATGVADVLAQAGIPFRTAHRIVAKTAEAGGDFDTLETVTQDVLGKSIDALTDPDRVKAALDPQSNVGMRDSLGGPAPTAVQSALETARERLAADETSISQKLIANEEAASRRTDEVTTYLP